MLENTEGTIQNSPFPRKRPSCNSYNIFFSLSYTEKKTLETYHNRHNSKIVSLRDLGSSPLFIISYDLVTGLKVKDYLDPWLCYYSNSETIIDTEKVKS